MVGLLGVAGSLSVRRTDSPGVAACQRGLDSALAMRRSLESAWKAALGDPLLRALSTTPGDRLDLPLPYRQTRAGESRPSLLFVYLRVTARLVYAFAG